MWTKTVRPMYPPIFENGKLFRFHFLFPGGRKAERIWIARKQSKELKDMSVVVRLKPTKG